VKEAVFFLQALNEGRMIGTDTVERMHDWRPMNNLPFQYGYGTMYLDFSFINLGTDPPPLWGHSGSPGSFLYYSEDLDLYMAGTINQTENLIVPLRLMMQVLEVMG
jgi:D-alanyl-D-alanine carboxypeptidase